MLYPLIESTLPEETLRVWERSHMSPSHGTDMVNTDKLTRLMNFLKIEVQGEVRINAVKTAFHRESTTTKSKAKGFSKEVRSEQAIATTTDLANSTYNRACVFCGKTHMSQECHLAQDMELAARQNKVKRGNACFSCLLPGHVAKQCKSKVKCCICKGKHYPIMCKAVNGQSSKTFGQQEVTVTTKEEKVGTEPSLANMNKGGICLQTLVVRVIGPEGVYRVRAIIDTGSQRSYITKEAVKALGLTEISEVILTHSLFGGGELREHRHKLYQVQISNIVGNFKSSFKLLDQDKICGFVSRVDNPEVVKELKMRQIELTDVNCGQDYKEIHILFGADSYSSIITGKTRKLRSGPIAIETRLGWTVIGGQGVNSNLFNSSLTVTSLHVNSFDIQNLWRLDIIGIQEPTETKKKEELVRSAKEYFEKTVTQLEDGRYKVSLPWIEGHPPIPVNRKLAEHRLKNVTKKLQHLDMYNKYNQIFVDWKEAGIIEEVEDELEGCSYLPHRPVVKNSSTTPIRPVFDASARSKGLPSVNDCLEKGENMIELIPDLLLKFRKNQCAVTADIRKAFLQIIVEEKDREFLRFLWWKEDRSSIQVYRHCRVVFGLTSSPFLLAATIHHHLDKERQLSKYETTTLKQSFYVDNCITSLKSHEDVRNFIEEATKVMGKAQFVLRDWVWRDPARIISTPVAVLGLIWDVTKDTLSIDLRSIDAMDKEVQVTKREILAACHRIFDPIGFTLPVTIAMKRIIQEAWIQKKSWDEPVDEPMKGKFLKWKKEINTLSRIQIPRWIQPIEGKLSFHVFCDASSTAYATCIFLRCETVERVSVHLVTAKNRLSTIKRITIPRLELLSCLIGARLMSTVQKAFTLDEWEVYYWTDSSNALYWIQRSDNWAEFVFNRVKEINKLTKGEDWHHVAGELNPADLPSRGCSPSQLEKSLWWEGPSWLRQRKEDWPTSCVRFDLEIIMNEKRRSVVSAHSVNKEVTIPWYTQLYQGKRETTLPQILRVIARILRWRNKKSEVEISQEELNYAENCLVRMVQAETYHEEDVQLKQLRAFRDVNGLWRVKTKIINREDAEYFRLPILLPPNHPMTRLIVTTSHQKMYHCGVHVLLSSLRERYWIPRARKLVRNIVHTCLRCRRFEVKRPSVPEPPLQMHRIRDAIAFEVVGIDLGGPLYLRDKKKAWFVVFTCAVYRAAHLELVTSLSTKALVGAIERFIARRGCPTLIFSDNGTNLVGVRNELLKINSSIKWFLNPPASPWWGGWFERIVGLVKRLLLRLLGRGIVDYEEMVTILANCERVINSRPLTYLSEDTDDLTPISPDMFLREVKEHGEVDWPVAGCDFGERFRKRLGILREFRKRFRVEYLGLLVHRDNRKLQHRVKVGDIVLLELENKKRIDWPLGRITDVFPGTDGVVRVVNVRTKAGTFRRSVQRVFPLEVPTEDVITVAAEEMDPSVDRKKVFSRSGREIKLPLKFRESSK